MGYGATFGDAFRQRNAEQRFAKRTADRAAGLICNCGDPKPATVSMCDDCYAEYQSDIAGPFFENMMGELADV